MSTVASRISALRSWRRGAQLATARLRWQPVVALACFTLTVVAVTAFAARGRAPIEAPGRALGVVLRWIVPLSSFAISSLCVGRARMDDSVWPVAGHGIPRRYVVLGVTSTAMLSSAVLGAMAASIALVIAYGSMPGLWSDLPTSSWIAALGGASYAAWFSLGASFMRLGRARWAPLVADFTLGATGGLLAVVWPRAHLLNLAGGDALLDLSQPTSSVLLIGMTVIVVCLAAMRAGD